MANRTIFELYADDRQFQSKLRDVQNKSKGAFDRIAGFGAKAFFALEGFKAVAAPFERFVKTANALDTATRKIDAASRLTGTSFQFLQSTAKNLETTYQLTTEQANEFTVAANKLAVASGDASKTGIVLERLFDLAAGQGLNASQALLRFEQSIKGIDEGTEALFSGKNPIDLYKDFAKEIGTTAGKLDDAQKKQAILNAILRDGAILQGEYNKFINSAAGEQQRLSTQLTQVTANFGKVLNQALIPILQLATPLLSAISRLDSSIIKLVGSLGGLVIAARAVNISFTSILGPVGLLTGAVAALGIAYSEGLVNIKGLAVIAGSAIASLTVATTALGLSFKAALGPIGAIVAGVSALVIAFQSGAIDIKGAVGIIITALGAVGAAVRIFGISLKSALGPIGLVIAALTSLYIAYQNNFAGIQDIVTGALQSISNFFSSAYDELILFGNRVTLYTSAIFSNIVNTATAFSNSIRLIFTSLKDLVKELFAQIATGDFNFADTISAKFSEAAENAKQIFSNLDKDISNSFKDVEVKIKVKADELELARTRKQLERAAAEFRKSQSIRVENAGAADASASLINANNNVASSVSNVTSKYAELNAALSSIKLNSSEISIKAEEQQTVVQGILDSSTQLFETNNQKVKDLISDLVVTVEEKGAQLAQLASDIGTAIGTSISGAIIGTKDSLKEGLKQILVTVLSFVQRLVLAAQTAAGIEALLGNPLALLKVAGVQAAFEALKASILSFAIGTENFAGGFAQVHKDEILYLPNGTNVYNKRESSQLFRTNDTNMRETNDLLKQLVAITADKKIVITGAQIQEISRKNARNMY